MRSLNPNCQDCGLCQNTHRQPCLKGTGDEETDLMIIAESPIGRQGLAISGDSWTILQTALKKAGIHSYYLTTIVKCPTEHATAPSPAEIKACKKYLDQEIETIKPRLIITLGVVPTKTLFRGKAKINEVHGELIENPKVNYLGIPTFSPAYTLRDPSKLPGFESDIARAGIVLRGEETDSTVRWNIVRRGNLTKFLQEFYDSPDFAFDAETSGLFMHDPKGYITAFCIALKHCSWIIPGFLHPNYMQYCKSPWVHGNALYMLLSLLIDISRKTKKKAYGWNAKFDNKWLIRKTGKRFRLDFDGMLAAHMLNENTANDLSSNTRTFLHEPDYDIPVKEKQGMTKEPMRMYFYCAKDGAYTYRLTHIFMSMLAEDAMLNRLFYRLTMRAARALEKIELRGLTINKEQMDEQGLELVSRRIQLEQKLKKAIGKEINWNSPQQVGKLLYDELGLPCTLHTAKGSPSTSEEAVLDLKGKHPIVDMLIEYREVVKFHSTYIKGFREYMIGNILYIDYKIHGTVTGRYSSRIHSIPRDGKIRNLVEAPEGWEFVQGDLATAELRVAASISQDPEMTRCFREGVDVHWRTLMNTLALGGAGEYIPHLLETARKSIVGGDTKFTIAEAVDCLLDLGPDEAIKIWSGWKEGRKRAKAVNFGFIYGMFEKKFIQTAKIKYGWEPTLDEAHEQREAYFELYPGLRPWHDKQRKLVKINGYVRNPFGRLRRLPGITSKDKWIRMEAERQAINSPVQGCIGDWKAAILVEIEETLDHEKLQIVGEHHDAVLMIVRSDAKQEMLPKVREVMRHPALVDELKVRMRVPMEGELEIGPWGKGKKFRIE